MIIPHFNQALIDGDRITMGAGFGSEKSKDGELIQLVPLSHALHKAKLILNRIKEAVSADTYKIYLGSKDVKHFRYKVAKTLEYKANRKDVKRPEYEQDIRDYLVRYHGAIIVEGVEVDDALGIEQKEDTIICSNDKDLDMIPGWHYDIDFGIVRNFKGKDYTMKSYKKSSTYFIEDPGFLSIRKNVNGKKKLVGGGQLWFCAQLLTGDKVDNIPGCPLSSRSTYGDVSTYEALKDCKTYEDGVRTVWRLYKDNGLDKNRLFEVAQLLWIKRFLKEKIFPKEWLI